MTSGVQVLLILCEGAITFLTTRLCLSIAPPFSASSDFMVALAPDVVYLTL